MADYIRPTPRNPILGLLADALTGGVDWMRDPRRAQQMQGIGGLLAETGIPATMERLSYGEPLTKGSGMTTRLRPEAEAALMTLGPEAVPIGRGAMAAVRATKGLPVGAATVYHGSPYRFQRFDPTKIGSGEGAQSYGYGHYVAESPGVAKSYTQSVIRPDVSGLSDEAKKVFDKAAKEIINTTGNPSLITPAYTANFAASKTKKPDVIKELMSYADNPPPAQGNLYTIDLPDPAIARMLDWDKPLSEQAQAKSVLERIGKEISLPKMQAAEGAGFAYQHLANAVGGPKNAAALLRNEGIPGIRYLDQGSRSNFRVQNTYKGQPYGEPVSFMTEQQAKDYAAEQIRKGFGTNILPGTSNFVVFPGEEDLLRILSVDGGLLGR